MKKELGMADGAKIDWDKKYVAVMKLGFDALWHAYYSRSKSITYDRVSQANAIKISKKLAREQESFLITTC